MANPEHLEAFRNGPEGIRLWREGHPEGQLDLSESELNYWPDLGEKPRFRPDFRNANLRKTRFIGRDFYKADFGGALLRKAKFISADLGGANFSGAELTGADLSEANLSEANLNGANLSDANLNKADLRKANLSGATFSGTIATHANLTGADISNVRFESTDLTDATLLNVTVDQQTSFANVKSVIKCKITRITLASLREYGDLTIGNRIDMDIVNDVALLRRGFSGMRFWIYIVLILVFLTPYLNFLIRQSLRSSFDLPAHDSISVFQSIGYFIWSGGTTWTAPRLNFWPFASFVVFIFYNALRASLLWKTKELELEEEATGLPSKFVFATHPRWHRAFLATRLFAYVAILVVIYHSWHFLSARVPIPSGH